MPLASSTYVPTGHAPPAMHADPAGHGASSSSSTRTTTVDDGAYPAAPPAYRASADAAVWVRVCSSAPSRSVSTTAATVTARGVAQLPDVNRRLVGVTHTSAPLPTATATLTFTDAMGGESRATV
jgi:hypothetical protein